MTTVNLFSRGRSFYLVELARTETGPWIERAPAQRLPHTVSDAELGSAVRAALERPVVTVPDGTRGTAFRGADRLLVITRDGTRVQLIPTRHIPRRGFEFLTEESRTVDLNDNLGAHIRTQLSS
jgi:hypothetical protein